MRHARSDYDRIQDPQGKIPADEPVFLIRGQDVVAPLVVAYWADTAERYGVAPEVVHMVREWAQEISDYQQRMGFKVADVPETSIRDFEDWWAEKYSNTDETREGT